MKYYPRLGVYKASNVQFNPKTMTAYSYDWWKFVGLINGRVVFNNYYYSPSTIKHLHKVKRLLEQLNIHIHAIVECPQGLQDLGSGVRYYQDKIKGLEALISKKGTKKAKNQERLAEIVYLKGKIEVLEALMAKTYDV